MGYFSFEAYNAPETMVGVPETDANATRTVYLDRSYLDAVLKGVLQVCFKCSALLRQGPNCAASVQRMHQRLASLLHRRACASYKGFFFGRCMCDEQSRCRPPMRGRP